MLALFAITEFQQKLILAGVAAILGFTSGYVLELVKNRRTRRQEVVGFLELMADALTKMAVAFAKPEIPHEYGHVLNGLLRVCKVDAKAALGSVRVESLEKLAALASRAIKLDGSFASPAGSQGDGEARRQEWIVDAQRAAGDLKAKAAQFRVLGKFPKHSA